MLLLFQCLQWKYMYCICISNILSKNANHIVDTRTWHILPAILKEVLKSCPNGEVGIFHKKEVHLLKMLNAWDLNYNLGKHTLKELCYLDIHVHIYKTEQKHTYKK